MIVSKNTKLWQDKIGSTSNWLNDDWIYVETNSVLGQKIILNAPNIEFLFDDDGNLYDVKVVINAADGVIEIEKNIKITEIKHLNLNVIVHIVTFCFNYIRKIS